MNVELAEERIFLFPDRFTLENAEGRAWTRRTEAFGALAKIGGMISKPKDEEYELVYRERRLQPFWRLAAHTDHLYERRRDYRLKVGPEVQSVQVYGETLTTANREAALTLTELCREEARREWFFDGITKSAQPSLKTYLVHESTQASAEDLNAQVKGGTVVAPPQAKSSSLTRDVLAQVMPKIEADRIISEKISIEAIDLYYRPIYAFRYRWQGKEAVVEFDAVTGDVRTNGATFESYVGKIFDPRFLLDVGAEAAGMFIPGANLAKIVMIKGMQIAKKA